jgi:thiol:disulfide interchange protein DsbA
MKKYLILIAAFAVFSCSQPAEKVEGQIDIKTEQQVEEQVRWIEGTHYVVLNHKTTPEPQVQEFFSFWCPHCHNFEPIVAELKKRLGNKAEFIKMHVDFMGSASQEIQQQATAALIVGQHLGKGDIVKKAIFDHIHVKGLLLNTAEELSAILAANQISIKEFNEALADADVSQEIADRYKTFLKYRADLRSVPTFIVNGKYKAQFTNDMGREDLLALIIWLTEQQ